MERYLYMTLFPEALIASMLPPEDFCKYLAVGTEKRAHEHTMLFQISSDLESDYFKLSEIPQRCVPHPDGSPKHSLYISIYRVIEHISLEAFQDLFLVTKDGMVLRLSSAEYPQVAEDEFHLYQELCPVTPTIVSRFGPRDFCRFITDRSKAMWLPKVCFADMHLGDIGNEDMPASSLPYRDIEHIRNCVAELRNSQDNKEAKTVNRVHSHLFFYRTIKNGFFLGEGERIIWYPFPSMGELQSKYYSWWRSASLGL